MTAMGQRNPFYVSSLKRFCEPAWKRSASWFGLVMKGTYRLDDDGKVKRVKVDYVRCPSIDLVKAKKAVGTR